MVDIICQEEPEVSKKIAEHDYEGIKSKMTEFSYH